MPTCLIGLGSNLGDRLAFLRRAVDLLASHPQIAIAAVSRCYRTRPVGGTSHQSEYLNAAARLDTSLPPDTLLQELLRTETQLGRIRDQRWGPRVVDLDLLLYERQVLQTPHLVLPHPRMAFRRFVLVPAVEIAADLVHPLLGRTLRELLRHLESEPDYVAVAGPPGVGKTALATMVASRLPCRLIASPLPGPLPDRARRDPAGQIWETELQFLAQRTRNLARDAVCGSDVFISDFWFDQSLVYSWLWHDEALTERFEVAWRAAQESVTQPKLLVLLDAVPGRAIIPHDRPGWQSASRWEEFRSRLARQVASNDTSLHLRLDASDLEQATTEVCAAMQAMREVPS